MTEFRQVLHGLVAEYGGTKQDLARAVGITPPTVSKLLSGLARPTPELCLRLAQATRTTPSTLLRAARHGAMAELIEDLYGPPRRPIAAGFQATPLEERYVKHLRTLRAPVRKAFLVLLDGASAPARPARAPRRRSA